MTGSALVTANQPHCSPCSILALAALALAPARLTQATPLSALCKQTPAPGSLHCSLHAVNQTRTDRQTDKWTDCSLLQAGRRRTEIHRT